MKLINILESLLGELNIPKPEDAYPFDSVIKKDLGYGMMYTYVYTNVLGQQMEVSNMVQKLPKDPGKSIYIAFSKHDPNEDDDDDEEKYGEKTGANDALKVLATVVEATKRTMKSVGGENKVYSILYSPADKKRDNIYLHYIKTLFPSFEEESSKEGKFNKFINTNFKKK